MDETEIDEIDEIDETETKKKKKVSHKATVLILESEGIKVVKDSMSYTVTGGKKGTNYFPNLESSLYEVSDRLFFDKLIERESNGRQKDIDSLISLIREHKREIKEKFRL